MLSNFIIIDDWRYTTFDFYGSIKSTIQLKQIADNISLLDYYVYNIKSQNPNSLHLKYKRVDNFESYENIKRFFIQLKRDNSKLSLSDFSNAWEKEGKSLFNLSDLESI